MAKASQDRTDYRYKKIVYPRALAAMSDHDAAPIKAFLNAMWSDSQQITNQIVKAVKDGAHANGNKTTHGGAMNEWRGLLQPHVNFVLSTGGNWAASRANVLVAAGSMGRIASELTPNSNECKKNQLKAAFRAAKLNTICPGAGGGSWCSFDWF